MALAPLPNGLDPALFQQQACAAQVSDASPTAASSLEPLSLQGQGVWHDFWYQADAAAREKIAAEAEAVEQAALLQLDLPMLRSAMHQRPAMHTAAACLLIPS